MPVNSFDCFLLVKDALGLLSFTVIDILNDDVLPCSFAAVPIFFFLSHCLIKPLLPLFVSLSFLAFCLISSLTLGVYLSTLFWSLIRAGVNEG